MKRRRRHIIAIGGCVVLLGALLAVAEMWRRQAIPLRPLLPVSFEHADHREEPCADCHHNFLDGTGGGTCYGCHKSDPEISYHMEEMFHDFCEGCHVEKRLEGEEETGPPRECGGCHSMDHGIQPTQ